MKNLINIENQKGKLLVSSREVSKNFDKNHQHILRDIDELKEGVQNWTDLFYETTYIHEQNKQEYRKILMNKDGFTLLAMGFTGSKALQWKLKYIEAFNKMEKQLETQLPKLSKELKAIFTLDQRTVEINNRITDLEDNMPLFNVECKELQGLVRKIATKVLGGYKSPAYCDNSLRGKIYSDIQNQLKREFGVTRYEAIKRHQLELAKEIVKAYRAPIILMETVGIYNSQMAM